MVGPPSDMVGGDKYHMHVKNVHQTAPPLKFVFPGGAVAPISFSLLAGSPTHSGFGAAAYEMDSLWKGRNCRGVRQKKRFPGDASCALFSFV